MSDAAYWDSFSAAFWSGLWYSLIAGVATGCAVVLLLESGRASRELKTLRERLRLHIDRPSRLSRQTVLSAAPTGAEAVAALLDSAPLDAWSDQTVGNGGLLELLRSFQREYAEFVTTSYSIDSRLTDLISRFHFVQSDLDKNTDQMLEFFTLHTALHIDDDEPLPRYIVTAAINYNVVTFDVALNGFVTAQKAQCNTLVASLVRIRAAVNVEQD